MEWLGLIAVGFISSIVTKIWLSRKTIYGEMDVGWNEEKQVWDANVHFPQNINYHKYKKLIFTINKK